DEVIAELESEKATFEINAEQAGILHTVAKEDEDLKIGDVVATIDEKAQKSAGGSATPNVKNESGKSAVAASPKSSPEKAAVANEPESGNGKGKEETNQSGTIEIKVPVIGESIKEVTLTKWV